MPWYKLYLANGKYWKKLTMSEEDAAQMRRYYPKAKVVKFTPKRTRRRAADNMFAWTHLRGKGWF